MKDERENQSALRDSVEKDEEEEEEEGHEEKRK